MTGVHDCGSDAAAYVLGALEPDEARRFQQHLADCAYCRKEVEELTAAARVLPMAAEQLEVPREARARLMRQIRADSPNSAMREQRSQRLVRWIGTLWGSPRGRIAASGASLLAAGAVVLGLQITGGGATVIQAQLVGISGSAQLRLENHRAELVVRNLTPPGHGQIYEVWLQRGSSKPVPASVLFGVSPSGAADIGIPSSMRGVSAVLVTAEPLGGTKAPTHSPVIVANLD